MRTSLRPSEGPHANPLKGFFSVIQRVKIHRLESLQTVLTCGVVLKSSEASWPREGASDGWVVGKVLTAASIWIVFLDFRCSMSTSKLADHSSVHDMQFTGTGKDLGTNIFAESVELSSGIPAAGSHEMAYIMRERVGSCPSSYHLPSAHELGRGLSGVFGSFGFIELSDFGGDIRLDSHGMGTATMLAPQKLGWNVDSTSRPKSGDPMTTAASLEDGRQLAQCSTGRYSIPSFAEMSVGEVSHFECPGPPQPEQSCHSARPVAPCVSPTGTNSTLIDLDNSRSSKSEDAALPSCSYQLDTSVKTVSPSLQPSTRQKTRFHSQSMLGGGVQDAAVLKHLTDTVVDSTGSGTRQRTFGQQGPSVSMSRSPDFHGRSPPGELGSTGKGNQITSGNLNLFKLKQKSKEQSTPAPRKYRKRRAVNGTAMKYDVEVDSVPKILDHVQRERQRRDLMTSKIVALELLLPKCPKRDRVSVVYDAIELLKKLEHEVTALQKRLYETKLRRSSSLMYRQSPHLPKCLDWNLGTSGTCFSNGEVIKRSTGTYMKPIVSFGQSMRGTRPRQRSSMIASTQSVGRGEILDQRNLFMEFQIQLDDNVTIQEEKLLKCRCRKNYLSSMMGVVDEFQLDIISCSIMKLSGYSLCVMGLKTRRRKETNSAAQFAVRLRSVVDVDVGREALTISLSGAQISETYQIEPRSRHIDEGLATQFDSPTFGF